MANRQVLLSTHLHKHRKVVRSTTLRSATVTWAVYTHQRSKRPPKLTHGFTRAELILQRDSQSPVRLDRPSVYDVQFYPARHM